MKTILLITIFISLFINTKSLAENNMSLDSHVHGISEMTIVFEKQKLDIEIRSPAVNLVGFEHKAKAEHDIAAIKKAEVLLSNTNKIFLFSDVNCTLIEQNINVSSITEHDNNHGVSEHQYEKIHRNKRDHTISSLFSYFSIRCS